MCLHFIHFVFSDRSWREVGTWKADLIEHPISGRSWRSGNNTDQSFATPFKLSPFNSCPSVPTPSGKTLRSLTEADRHQGVINLQTIWPVPQGSAVVASVPMEAPAVGDMGEVCCPGSCSPEGETVCAALARYENTLRDAIREIHVDVSTFKLGMERRLEETNNLSGPLGRAVVHLQQENRQLRSQLDSLTRQVELLSGITCDRSTLLNNNHHTHAQNHKNHLDDIEENHHEIKEVIYGKGEAHTQSQAHLHMQTSTLGSQAQTYSSLSNQTIPASPPATFSSSSTSSSPPAGSRVSSMVTSPVSGSSPSITRFSSRATFAVSSKTNVSTS